MDNLEILIGRIEGTTDNKNFVLIVTNKETGENKLKFFDNAQAAKDEFFFVNHILRMANEKIL